MVAHFPSNETINDEGSALEPAAVEACDSGGWSSRGAACRALKKCDGSPWLAYFLCVALCSFALVASACFGFAFAPLGRSRSRFGAHFGALGALKLALKRAERGPRGVLDAPGALGARLGSLGELLGVPRGRLGELLGWSWAAPGDVLGRFVDLLGRVLALRGGVGSGN